MRKIWFGNDVLDQHVLLALQKLGSANVGAITKVTRQLLEDNKHVKPKFELSADEEWVWESLERLVENGSVIELEMGNYKAA